MIDSPKDLARVGIASDTATPSSTITIDVRPAVNNCVFFETIQKLNFVFLLSSTKVDSISAIFDRSRAFIGRKLGWQQERNSMNIVVYFVCVVVVCIDCFFFFVVFKGVGGFSSPPDVRQSHVHSLPTQKPPQRLEVIEKFIIIIIIIIVIVFVLLIFGFFCLFVVRFVVKKNLNFYHNWMRKKFLNWVCLFFFNFFFSIFNFQFFLPVKKTIFSKGKQFETNCSKQVNHIQFFLLISLNVNHFFYFFFLKKYTVASCKKR